MTRVAPSPRALFAAADQAPDRPRFFVPCDDGDFRPVTFRTHLEGVSEAAAALLTLGLEPGDRAAVFSSNRIEWLEAAFGIQAARGMLVPVYPSSTTEQLRYVLEHAGARLLFVDGPAQLRRVLEALPALPALERVVVLDDALDPFGPATELGLPIDDVDRRFCSWSRLRAEGRGTLQRDPALVRRSLEAVREDDGALMLYTSGTTGAPKGVPLTYDNLGTNMEDWIEAIGSGIPDDGVDLLWLPFSHIFGWGEVGLGHQLGLTTYLVSPDQAIARMRDVRPSIFMSVPAYWERIAKMADEESFATATGGRLRFCLSGGAGLDRNVKERFEREGVVILEGYGLTETSPTLTINRPDHYRFDTVGKPLERVELELAEDGEVLARGPSVFGGYFRDEEATRRAFTGDGWFKTGDLGRLTDEGFLQIIGRKKEILVTAGGKNIPPANIERRFENDPAIERVVVYGDGKKYLVAAVWPTRSDTDHADIAARIDAVNATLARFETIKRFVVIDEPLSVENGLLTPTLKLKRKKVYERYADRLEALYA